MHLSIQKHAHAQAEKLVQAWGKQAGVEIASVRYHILRNALILKNIHIQRGDDEISIEHMLVRTNPALLNSPTLHVGHVEISGIKATLHLSQALQSNSVHAWLDDPQLMKIWQATSSLKAQHGQLRLYFSERHFSERPIAEPHRSEQLLSGSDLSKPHATQQARSRASDAALIINDISIRLSSQSTQRSLIASGRVHEGSVQWQQHSNSQDNTATGQLHWQHVNTSLLSRALTLKPIAGHLQGNLSWQQFAAKQQLDSHSPNRIKDDPQNSLQNNIQASIQFNASESSPEHLMLSSSAGKPHSEQQLEFTAQQQNKQWNIDLHARAWPLAPWVDVIPSIGQQQLLSAQLNGSSHWQQQSKGWKISAKDGTLQHVIWQTQSAHHDLQNKAISDTLQHNDKAHWSWREIHFDQAWIDTAEHHLHLSQLKLKHGNLVFNMASEPQSDNNNPTSTATVAPLQKTEHKPDWRFSVDHIQAKAMALKLHLTHGTLNLKALQAEASWPRRKPLTFNISSVASIEPETPQWRLRGSITRKPATQASHANASAAAPSTKTDPPKTVPSKTNFAKANFSVQAKHIPLAQLRLLIPLQGDANSPVRLAGTLDWRSDVSLNQGQWRMQGRVTAYDVQISHAGDKWTAQQVSSRFGPIGNGLETQTITQINADGWSYIAALEPLRPLPSNTVKSALSPDQTAWWVSAMNNNNIHIQHLRFNDGSLSIGHSTSTWASNIAIQLDDLQSKRWATVNITANVSDGDFKLSGTYNSLAEPPRFNGSISLHAATPFFLHEWLTASGMPRLIRGRLNASLNIDDQPESNVYQSQWKLQLSRPIAEKGFFNNDPMLTRSGLNTDYLLRRLSQETNTISLAGQLNGDWQQQALNFNRLGNALQIALRQAISTAPPTNPAMQSAQTNSSATIAAHIRLHEHKSLSLNERSRLFKIVRQLHDNPAMTVDLKPQWAGKALNNDLLARIQHTQMLIERFLRHRKITRQRIFPRWPTIAEQGGEVSSIQIQLHP